MQSSGGRRTGRLRLRRVAALAGLVLAGGLAVQVASTPAGAAVAVPQLPGPGPLPLPPGELVGGLRSAPVVEQGTGTPPAASPPAPAPVPPSEPVPVPDPAGETSRVGEPPADSAVRRSTAGRSGPRSAPAVAVPPSPAPTTAPAAAVEEGTVDRLRRATVPAARDFGFPLALGVLVLAFLSLQGRLDRRDPKLAVAPVSMDDDLLPFA